MRDKHPVRLRPENMSKGTPMPRSNIISSLLRGFFTGKQPKGTGEHIGTGESSVPVVRAKLQAQVSPGPVLVS